MRMDKKQDKWILLKIMKSRHSLSEKSFFFVIKKRLFSHHSMKLIFASVDTSFVVFFARKQWERDRKK